MTSKKVYFDRKEWNASLDSISIKAIRFMLGYKTDLRVRLNNDVKDVIFNFIQSNEVEIFGPDIAPRPSVLSDEWEKYESMIWCVVRQVIR